jgi:hypothetical protein
MEENCETLTGQHEQLARVNEDGTLTSLARSFGFNDSRDCEMLIRFFTGIVKVLERSFGFSLVSFAVFHGSLKKLQTISLQL